MKLVSVARWATPFGEIKWNYSIDGLAVDEKRFYSAMVTGAWRRCEKVAKRRITITYTPDNRRERGI